MNFLYEWLRYFHNCSVDIGYLFEHFLKPSRFGYLHLKGGQGILLRHAATSHPLPLQRRRGRYFHQLGFQQEKNRGKERVAHQSHGREEAPHRDGSSRGKHFIHIALLSLFFFFWVKCYWYFEFYSSLKFHNYALSKVHNYFKAH